LRRILRLGLELRLRPAHAARRPWRRVADELRERRGRADERRAQECRVNK
jgi:hypothetical protein